MMRSNLCERSSWAFIYFFLATTCALFNIYFHVLFEVYALSVRYCNCILAYFLRPKRPPFFFSSLGAGAGAGLPAGAAAFDHKLRTMVSNAA